MRLRICCCYCTDDGPTCTEAENSNGSTLPRVVVEQPKPRRSIQTADESAVPRKEDKEVAQQEVVSDKQFSDIKPAAEIQGNKAYTQSDTASVTDTVPRSVEESIPQAADDGVAAQRNELTRVTTEESQSPVTFNVIAPGHFQSVYKGVEYHIVNGSIQSISGACDESNNEFILAQYASAMRGVQRAMEGLEKGLLGTGRQMNALQPTEPHVHSILASLHHPPRPPSPPQANANMTREKFIKLLNQMRDEVRKEEESKAPDTTESVDGGYRS